MFAEPGQPGQVKSDTIPESALAVKDRQSQLTPPLSCHLDFSSLELGLAKIQDTSLVLLLETFQSR